MEREVYRSRAYDRRRVAKRYLRYWGATDRYTVYEVAENNLTIREVDTDGEGLPAAKLAAARSTTVQIRLD